MRARTTNRTRRKEAGIALLIAIFILLLIAVVAIALIVSSGTESALAGNYRSSTGAYYAALAGAEEARARLRSNNPNSFNNTAPGFLPAPGTPLAACSPVYVINPLGAEAVAPWDSTNAYYDAEFSQEFGASCPAPLPPNPSPSTASVWNSAPLNGLAFPGPLYKWVRINGVSEKSLNLDVDADGQPDSTTPLYFDSVNRLFSNNAGAGPQALELTALAVLPDGSQKLLQYMVTSAPPTFPNFPPNLLSFPAALTMAGNATNGVAFSPPKSSSSYFVSGTDLTPSCGTGPTHAIGVFDDPPDKSNVISGGNGGSGIPVGMQSKYVGVTNPGPDVVNVISAGLLSSNLQNPSQVDAIAQTITQNADVVIPSGVVTYPLPTINGSQLSASTTAMSSTNPMTVVVNGNLDLTAWRNTGYGLLLVTGNLNYDPDASWQGMILVIGQGTVTGSMSGTGEIDGEVFVAKTRDTNGNLLASLGKAFINFGNNMGGTGIRYSSCWVQSAQPRGSYKILSFHEIAQ